MDDEVPKLSRLTHIGQGLPDLFDIYKELLRNRHRIKDAYDGGPQYNSFISSNVTCPWSGCTMVAMQSHVHIHRASSGFCDWSCCELTETHLHKYKLPPLDPSQDTSSTSRYNWVKAVVMDILGKQHYEEAPARYIYEQLDEERQAEETEKKMKAKRLSDAEEAGEKAAQEFEAATAAKRARRAEDRKRAKEIEEASEQKKLRRRAARAQMAEEDETGNEVERDFTTPVVGRRLIQDMRDAQLGVFHSIPTNIQVAGPTQMATGDEANDCTSVKLGKRKRAESPPSRTSSLTSIDAAQLDLLMPEEAPLETESAVADVEIMDRGSSPQSETSDLTVYDADELDAVLSGAEVIVQEPAARLFTLTPPRSPVEPVSSDTDPEIVAGLSEKHSSTPPTSADEDKEPLNAFILGHMPPPPPRPPRLSESEAAEKAEMKEQQARRRQIQGVLKDREYYTSAQRADWKKIKICEDPEDRVDG